MTDLTSNDANSLRTDLNRATIDAAIAIVKDVVLSRRSWNLFLTGAVLAMASTIAVVMLGLSGNSFDLVLLVLSAVYSFVVYNRLGISLRHHASSTYRITPVFPDCFLLAMPIIFLFFSGIPGLLLLVDGTTVAVQVLAVQFLVAIMVLLIFATRSPMWLALVTMVGCWSVYVYFGSVSVENTLGLYERSTQTVLPLIFGLLLFVTAACSRLGRFGRADGTLVQPPKKQRPNATSIYRKIPAYMKHKRIEEKPLWWWLRFGTFDLRNIGVIAGVYTLFVGFVLLSAYIAALTATPASQVAFEASALQDVSSSNLFAWFLGFLFVVIFMTSGDALLMVGPWRRLFLQSPVESMHLFKEHMVRLIFARFLIGIALSILVAWILNFVFTGYFAIHLFAVIVVTLSRTASTWSKSSGTKELNLHYLLRDVFFLATCLSVYFTLWTGSLAQYLVLGLVELFLIVVMYWSLTHWSRSDAEFH
jgi:hypothetical protein